MKMVVSGLIGSYSQEIEAIKARVKEMEEEAEKLKEMQGEVEKQLMGKPGWREQMCIVSGQNLTSVYVLSLVTAGASFPSLEEKMESDGRSVYVGNVSFFGWYFERWPHGGLRLF